MSTVLMSDLGFNLPDPMGAPPEGLKTVMATRQNTLALADKKPVIVKAPTTGGGWLWHILNMGPGRVFARWDRLGYAGPEDANSVQLVAGVGFNGITGPIFTLVSVGESNVTFSAETEPQGGFFVKGELTPPPPPAPPEQEPELKVEPEAEEAEEAPEDEPDEPKTPPPRGRSSYRR